MSRAQLHFQVDSRCATLLSQEYPSSERALKELGHCRTAASRTICQCRPFCGNTGKLQFFTGTLYPLHL